MEIDKEAVEKYKEYKKIRKQMGLLIGLVGRELIDYNREQLEKSCGQRIKESKLINI